MGASARLPRTNSHPCLDRGTRRTRPLVHRQLESFARHCHSTLDTDRTHPWSQRVLACARLISPLVAIDPKPLVRPRKEPDAGLVHGKLTSWYSDVLPWITGARAAPIIDPERCSRKAAACRQPVRTDRSEEHT